MAIALKVLVCLFLVTAAQEKTVSAIPFEITYYVLPASPYGNWPPFLHWLTGPAQKPHSGTDQGTKHETGDDTAHDDDHAVADEGDIDELPKGTPPPKTEQDEAGYGTDAHSTPDPDTECEIIGEDHHHDTVFK